VTNLCGNCLMPFDPVDLCWCEWCDDCCDKAGGTDRHDEDGLRSYPIFDRSFGRYMEQTPYNGRISPDPKAYPQARQEINTTRGERMKAAWEEADKRDFTAGEMIEVGRTRGLYREPEPLPPPSEVRNRDPDRIAYWEDAFDEVEAAFESMREAEDKGGWWCSGCRKHVPRDRFPEGECQDENYCIYCFRRVFLREPAPPEPKSILEEAAKVVEDRKAQYDERERNFTRIADIWSVIFGHTVWPEQVAMCMIGLKLAREVYKPSRDNLTDIAGYADCLADLRGYYDPVTASPTEAPASAEGEGTAVSPPSATRSAPSPDKGPMGWV
jgi:hypothetical protein